MKIKNDEYVFKTEDLNVVKIDDVIHRVSHKEQFYNISSIEDYKRIIAHYIILETCNRLARVKNRNKALVIQKDIHLNSEDINQFGKDNDTISNIILEVFSTYKNALPFAVYIDDKNTSLDQDSGELSELVANVKSLIQNHKDKSYSARKFKNITSNSGLRYLHDNYINSTEFQKLQYQ